MLGKPFLSLFSKYVTDRSDLYNFSIFGKALIEIWVNPISNIFSALQLWSPIKWVVGHLSEKMLVCNNIHARGRANLPFPAKLKPQKWLYLANTFLALAPREVAALVPVSDDKTQITSMILMRGALSTQTSQTKRLQEKLRDFFSFPPSQLIIAALQVVSIQ